MAAGAAVAAAGARGTGREQPEPGSVRRVGAYTKYFPFKAERDRGGEGEIKKEKEERPRGRVGEREGARVLKKRERCHPVD